MTPAERLKSFEEWPPDEDGVNWLIARVKRLTEALEEISKTNTVGMITQDWLREWRNETKINARKALGDQ